MNANYNLLYVDSAPKARDFYADLFGQKPVEDSENFVLFVLPNGVKFGLWNRRDVTPAANQPGGFELGLPVASKDVLLGWYPNTNLEMSESARTRKFGKYGSAKYIYPKPTMSELRSWFEAEVSEVLPTARYLYWT